MLDIFNSPPGSFPNQRQPPDLPYLRRMYQREIATLQFYYQNRVYAVKNQNLLVRMIQHIDTPMDYNVDQFIEVTRTRAPYIAKAFRLTSEIDYGNIHSGPFYGEDTNEILLYNDEYFNPIYFEKNWKRIVAVSCIWHPRSDMGFMLPNGRPSSTDVGLAVSAINIPLLALQYREFLKEQLLQRQDKQSMLGPNHFVHMYVLPNMMYTHTDIVIINRMMNLFYNRAMGVSKHKHPFPIVQYENKLDNVLLKIIDEYKDRPMEYPWLLNIIPGISKNSGLETLQLPDIPPTRQVWWSMVLSRLDIIKFLIDLGGTESIRRNMVHLNQLKKILHRLMRENIYSQTLPFVDLKPINEKIEKLLEVID